ncbi:CRE-CLEC-100 protein [Caenorhabditis remanei]|uniref:CRE-CLEC-100 protein n=1 Tax=Caenorhabditis remanei TaxID=31234 RepID=E3M8S0_CAERE|nr:CRE-CLEC-100 protein [Caenorhabditis remanei]
MSHLKLLLTISLLFLISTSSARDFGDDSSCESSEEHGGGHGGRPRPPRPPQPTQRPDDAHRPRCAQGWFTSYRPQGIWCIRVGIGKLDYNQAAAQCATYGGVLSGIQNDWERWLISNEANRQTLAYNIQYSGIWLGAQRNPGSNTFSWTDGHTTGVQGMVFGPGQPDNKNRDNRGPQNCLQLIALTPGFWNNPGSQVFVSYQSGQIDDYWCDQVEDPAQRMYACGKLGPRE